MAFGVIRQPPQRSTLLTATLRMTYVGASQGIKMTELAAPQISSLMEALPGIAAVLRNPVAAAMVALARAGAGLEPFKVADAEELLRFGMRRNLLAEEEVERVLEEIRGAAEAASTAKVAKAAKAADRASAKASAKADKGSAGSVPAVKKAASSKPVSPKKAAAPKKAAPPKKASAAKKVAPSKKVAAPKKAAAPKKVAAKKPAPKKPASKKAAPKKKR